MPDWICLIWMRVTYLPLWNIAPWWDGWNFTAWMDKILKTISHFITLSMMDGERKFIDLSWPYYIKNKTTTFLWHLTNLENPVVIWLRKIVKYSVVHKKCKPITEFNYRTVKYRQFTRQQKKVWFINNEALKKCFLGCKFQPAFQ